MLDSNILEVYGYERSAWTRITYDPARINGPGSMACEQMTWETGATTVATESAGQPDSVYEDTIVQTSTILGIDEVVTVPAGTFTTWLTRVEQTTGQSSYVSFTWTDRATGLQVKRESGYSGGDVDAVVELVSLELP